MVSDESQNLEHIFNFCLPYVLQMSRNVRKRTFGNVRPAKMQVSLRIRAV